MGGIDLRPLVWFAVAGMVLIVYEVGRLIWWLCSHVTVGWES